MTDLIDMAMLRFADPAQDAAFRTQGYAIVSMLAAEEVAALAGAWAAADDITRHFPYGASLFSPDPGYRRRMSDLVTAALVPKLAEVLPGTTLLYGSFASKAPNEPASMVPFHQDPSYVDESRWGAANIWVPLVDIDADNGPLWVVPGSHRFNRGRRAFNQSFVYAADQDALAELARPLLVRAGEAVVLAHSLFHFSPPNRSARPRPAIGAVLVERGAPLYYNIIDGADRDWIEIFEADPELFLAAPISTRPNRAATARAPVQVEILSIEAVRRGSFPNVPA